MSLSKHIDMGVMASLRARAMAMHGDVVLPAIRFFTGNDLFFSSLKALVDEKGGRPMILECGCGSQDTTRDLAARGFLVRGVDLYRREGQTSDVYIQDAVMMPFDEMTWALLCRPDHSGWASDTIERCIKRGGVGIYVGLEKNYHQDIDEDVNEFMVKRICNVGVEGEDMWVFK